MRLALLPGLLMALFLGAMASGNSTARAAGQAHNGYTAPLFSIGAQAATTATTTLGTTPATGGATATAALTGTTVVTSTDAISPTATLAPLTSGTTTNGGGTNLKLNPFDWGFLTNPPSDPKMGPFSWLGLLIMAGLFAVSAYFYLYRRPAWKRANPVRYKAANRWGPAGLWLAILGLLLLLFRLIDLSFFNLRFWMYLWLLAAIASVAYFAYWYRTAYPKEVARYEKTQRARQYMPGSTRAAARATSGPSTPTPARTAANKSTSSTPAAAQRPSSSSSKKRKKR